MTETSPPEPPSEPAPTPPKRAASAPASTPPAAPPPPSSPPSSPPEDHTNVISLEEEMKSSYLDYAMSVIVSRALPDVRDGLKPVQRRILYAMKEGGYDWNRPYRKSARIVGDVMSKYHPHGDSAIYDSMARMAQDFSLRVPLVDGQGNFGSMDDDPPAAMRYTEARLARVASEGLLEDFDRDTVDFQPTYDESSTEPKVLPARFPNLLVNGAAGIAVGMATSIPPHNLGEVLNAARAYVENPNIDVAALTELVPGPDFPTGGLIMGRRQLAAAYAVGRGSVRARARVSQEPSRRGGGREALVITEVPPGVSKGRLLDRLAHAVRAQIVEGIADVRDESARGSVRVVIEIKRGVMAELVLNHLWKSTPLQTTVSLNLLAIDAGRPVVLTMRDAIESFVVFREEVVARRTAWFLAQSRARAHLLVGLMVSVSHIDEVVILIRAASSPTEARLALLERVWPVEAVRDALDLIADPAQLATEDGFYRLSEVQARGILEMRLQRLTGLERDKIVDELRGLKSEIEGNLEILRSRDKILEIVDAELVDMQERFATPRRTELMEDDIEQLTEDLIPREDVVVTLTHGGYVKRAPVSAYREQRRGGRGRAAMATHDDDFVTTAFVVSSHAYLLFFSTRGVVYRLKAWQLPEGSPQSRGKAMVNLLPLEADEAISALLPMPTDESVWEETHVVFATDTGRVRRNRLTDFARIRSCGKIAMHLDSGVRLIGVALCKPEQDVLLATGGGQCIRFPVSEVRVFRSRSSMGVRGIRLRAHDDSVIALAVLDHTEATSAERKAFLAEWRTHRRATEGEDATEDGEPLEANGAADTPDDTPDGDDDETTAISLAPERYTELETAHEMLLSVAANGLGRRSSAYAYRTSHRGGFGIRNGPARDAARVMAVFPVLAEDGIMLIMDSGRMIRTSVRDVRVVGRTSRGVRLLKIYKDKNEHLVSATRIIEIEGSATSDDDNTGDNTSGDTNGDDTNGDTNVDANAPNGVAPESHAAPEAPESPEPSAANGGEESGS